MVHSPRNLTALEQVVAALSDLKHNGGCLVKHIVHHIRTVHEEPKQIPIEQRIEKRVRRGLRQGLKCGLFECNGGRYKLTEREKFELFNRGVPVLRSISDHKRQLRKMNGRSQKRKGRSRRQRSQRNYRRGGRRSRSSKPRPAKKSRRRRRSKDDSSVVSSSGTTVSKTATSITVSDRSKSREERSRSNSQAETKPKRRPKRKRKIEDEKEKKVENEEEKSQQKTDPPQQQQNKVENINNDSGIKRVKKESQSSSRVRCSSDPKEDSHVVPPKKSLGRLTLNHSSLSTSVERKSRGRSRAASRSRHACMDLSRSAGEFEDEKFTGEPSDANTSFNFKNDKHDERDDPPSYVN